MGEASFQSHRASGGGPEPLEAIPFRVGEGGSGMGEGEEGIGGVSLNGHLKAREEGGVTSVQA